ncbi:MAG: methionine gamma-lyase family protein, partial [Clostridiales bacterium]|nr:methionine gamma-lyase family protein [Clostridiales bacterium]
LSIALFGILRPGDLLLAISGKPYDTLDDMIHKSGIGSLKDFGIKYSQIDLRDDGFDCEKITEAVSKERPRAVYIQRSKGYDRRTSLTVEAIQDIIKKVRAAGSGAVIMVDNCYGEFVETREPTEVGADIIAGSFIKNPGGGIAPSGGYIAGAAKLIDGIAGRLTVPGVGAEIGSFSGGYASYYQGIFLAPHVVSQAVKGAYLAAAVFRLIGYRARPFIDETLSDIVCSIEFKTSDELLSFCRSIQAFSPVDSHVTPLPWDMPGYAHQVIMAAGTFVQGASIELSCDSPIKEPFTAYLQGGLTYEHIKLALGYAIAELELAD